MPLSNDADLRARQLANLKPNARMTTGAHSEASIEPLRTEHLVRLRERFPSADDALLAIQAERAAQIDLISAYLGKRAGVGAVLRNRRTATVWPAREFAAKLQGAYERLHERLEAQEREADTGDPVAKVRAHIASLGSRDGDDD